MIKIAPSLLSADFTRLGEEIENIRNAGADLLHLDIMDGHFVPNLTFGIPIIEQIKNKSKIPLDVHLMVTNPQDYFDILADIGVEYVSFHAEIGFHHHRQIYHLKDRNVKAGIVLNPATPVDLISPIIPDLDFVLLMSVNPGFGGQKFLSLVYEKLQFIKKISEKKNPQLEIEIDGGVDNTNAKKLTEFGADILVSGSYVFHSSDYRKRIESLRVTS